MGKSLRIHTMLVAVLLVCTAPVLAVEIDLVTGEPAEEWSSTPIPEAGTDALEILWDLTHGVYLNYTPYGSYSDLTSELTAVGFNTNTTDIGVHNVDLTQYDVVVVFLTSAWDSPYTTEEVDSLVSYVDQGGGLLIAGANSGCPNANINPVGEAFGTTLGITSNEPNDLYFTDFISHQIYYGITQVYFRATGQLVCVPPSVEAAWSPTYSEILISLLDPSPPRVVCLGTSTGFSNNYFQNAQNVAFAINVFHFLAGSPVALERATWGEIKALEF
jgi:hypothetical protein